MIRPWCTCSCLNTNTVPEEKPYWNLGLAIWGFSLLDDNQFSMGLVFLCAIMKGTQRLEQNIMALHLPVCRIC